MNRKNGNIYAFSEGNIIYVINVNATGNVFVRPYFKDYARKLAVLFLEQDIALAYITVSNELAYASKPGQHKMIIETDPNGIILFLTLINQKGQPLLIYTERIGDETRITYVYPELQRKGKVLISMDDEIEIMHVYWDGENNILKYRLKKNGELKQFIINEKALGSISLDKYIICKEEALSEIERKCKLSEQKFKSESEKLIKEVEKKYKDKLHAIEKQYKENVTAIEKQYKEKYDELAKLTSEIQEEGKRWRTLYYKCINS